MTESLLNELRRAFNADFVPEEAFLASKMNPDASPAKAHQMYLDDQAAIERREPAFYENSTTTRLDAYIKYMLKRRQYDLPIPEWMSQT